MLATQVYNWWKRTHAQNDANWWVITAKDKKDPSRCQVRQSFKIQHQNQNIRTADALWNLPIKSKWKETIQKQTSVAPSFHCNLIYLLSLGCLFGSYFIKLLPSHLKIMPSLNWASLHCIFMIPKRYLSIQSSNCKLLAIRTESNNKNCKEFN